MNDELAGAGEGITIRRALLVVVLIVPTIVAAFIALWLLWVVVTYTLVLAFVFRQTLAHMIYDFIMWYYDGSWRRLRRVQHLNVVVRQTSLVTEQNLTDDYFGQVLMPNGEVQAMLTHRFEDAMANRDIRQRSRIVRLCALMVRGGLGANPERRSEAQMAVAEEWLRRQLRELTLNSMRYADMAWIVPVSVELAYNYMSVDEDIALIRKSRVIASLRERALGTGYLRIVDRVMQLYENVVPGH